MQLLLEIITEMPHIFDLFLLLCCCCWTSSVHSMQDSMASKDQIQFYRLERINGSSQYELLFYYFPLYKDPSTRLLPIPAADVCEKAYMMDRFDCIHCVHKIQQQNLIDASRFYDFAKVDTSFQDISSKFLLDIYENAEYYREGSPHFCVFGSISVQLAKLLLPLVASRVFENGTATVSFFTTLELVSESKPMSAVHIFDAMRRQRSLFEEKIRTNFLLLSDWAELPGDTATSCTLFHFRSPDAMEAITPLVAARLPGSRPLVLEERALRPLPSDDSRATWEGSAIAFDGVLHGTAVDFASNNCGVASFQWFKIFADQPAAVSFGHLLPPTAPPTPPTPPLRLPTDPSAADDFLRREARLFVTFDANFYPETARGLLAALRSVGYRRAEVMGPVDASRYLALLTAGRAVGAPVVQIAIGPHRPTMLARNYIVFHTENAWDSFLADPRYAVVLRGAAGVFVYSRANLDYLRSLDIPLDRAVVVPIYSRPLYFQRRLAPPADGLGPPTLLPFERRPPLAGAGAREGDEEAATEDDWRPMEEPPLFDLTLIGSDSHGRRRELIESILGRQQADGVSFVARQHLPGLDLFDVYTREFYVLHTKVVLNVHQFPDSVLETHRIDHLLALGKVVVSERSALDPQLDARYDGGVVFADYGELYEVALRFVRDDSLRLAQELRAFQKAAEIRQDTTALSRGLAAILRAPSLRP